jgi:histidyl-tRNA synthetase
MIQKVKGTQDFLDVTLFNFVITKIKKHLAQYNFTEIQTPLIEYLDLFQRSLGEHTEVVSKEMFVMESRQESSDGRMCLRPEMTASTVRAFNENGIQQLPWKVFSYGPCFRYERPQKGRYRQFHQITMEIIGSASISQDAQFITMLDRFFQHILHGVSYELNINFLGCSDDRAAFIQTLKNFLNSERGKGICSQCLYRKEHNVMRVFDCKSAQCQALYQNAPRITDSLCQCCSQEWQQLRQQLSVLSVTYVHRSTLVRGLDYYNKTVFEFVSKNLGAQDAFCGGGRYNQLAQQLGAREDQPSVGAAIGIERLMLLLELVGDKLPIEHNGPLHVIIPMSIEQHDMALMLADALRVENMRVDVLVDGSVKSMMRKANKLNAAFMLVLGETEQQNKTVMIKNMVTGEDVSVGHNVALEFLKKQTEL